MKIPKSKHIYSILAILLIVTTLLGCNKKEKVNKRYKIGFAQAQGGDNWRESMLKEMQREVSFHNQIAFYFRDAQANSQKQKEQIESIRLKMITDKIAPAQGGQPSTKKSLKERAAELAAQGKSRKETEAILTQEGY